MKEEKMKMGRKHKSQRNETFKIIQKKWRAEKQVVGKTRKSWSIIIMRKTWYERKTI